MFLEIYQARTRTFRTGRWQIWRCFPSFPGDRLFDDLALQDSGTVRFKDVVDTFKVHELPKKPEGKPEEWLAGKRVDTRGMFLRLNLWGRYLRLK